MPMLIIDDSTFEKELNKFIPAQSVPGGKVIQIDKGRPVGRVEVPETIRKIVAEEAILGTKPQELKDNFGVSLSSISAYKNGATSTASYNKPDKELKAANDSLITEVTSSARSRLALALEHITADKIEAAKVGTIAQIAKDMSAIVRNLEPTNPSITNNNQVIVYRPRQKEEDDFEVITVNE